MTSNIGSTFKKLVTLAVLVTLGSALLATQARSQDLITSGDINTGILSLKGDIRVDGEFVTLGDLFHLGEPHSGINVMRSPAPGARLAIPADALKRFIRRQGLSWANAMRLRQVMVARSSQEIRIDALHDAIDLAFEDMGLEAMMDIKFNNRGMVIHIPTGLTPELTIDSLDHDAATGRFVAEIRTPTDNGQTVLTKVSGHTVEVHEIPILMHPVPRGEIITAADLKTERMPVNRMGVNIIANAKTIIGMQTTRALRSNQPLRTSDLKARTLIKKGALITMVFESEGIKLTNVGRALENGSRNDIINVINPRSHQSVMALVTGNNQVSVSLSNMQIASAE